VCRCSPERARRYRERVSGPILDRFDLHVRLPPLSVGDLDAGPAGEPSEAVRQRVMQARARRLARGADAGLAGPRHALHAGGMQLDREARRLLVQSIDALGLSLRAYGKVQRVARTIADLEGSERIQIAHVAEAVSYRLLDRDADAFAPARASANLEPVAR
jgi:magnesium chelatase family protein